VGRLRVGGFRFASKTLKARLSQPKGKLEGLIYSICMSLGAIPKQLRCNSCSGAAAGVAPARLTFWPEARLRP